MAKVTDVLLWFRHMLPDLFKLAVDLFEDLDGDVEKGRRAIQDRRDEIKEKRAKVDAAMDSKWGSSFELPGTDFDMRAAGVPDDGDE